MKEGVSRKANPEEMDNMKRVRDFLRARLPGEYILLYQSGDEEVGVICSANTDMATTLRAVLKRMEEAGPQEEVFDPLPRSDRLN